MEEGNSATGTGSLGAMRRMGIAQAVTGKDTTMKQTSVEALRLEAMTILLIGMSVFLFACGDEADRHFHLGVVYHQQGLFDAAIVEYQKAIRLNLNNVEAYNNLGLIYIKQGKLDLAIAEFKRAIEIKLDYAEAHYNLGTIYLEQGKREEAVAALKKTIAIDPNDADAHNNLGFAYAKEGRLSEAMLAFQKAIQINPNHPNLTIWHNKIDACMLVGVHCYQANLSLNIIRGGTDCYTIAMCAMAGHEDAMLSFRFAIAEMIMSLADCVKKFKG